MTKAFCKKTVLLVVHRILAVLALVGAILGIIAANHANWDIDFAISNQIATGLMSLENATVVGAPL